MRYAKKIGLAAITIAIASIALAHAQSSRPAFEVASIKPNNSGQPRPQGNPFRLSPGGMFTAKQARPGDQDKTGTPPMKSCKDVFRTTQIRLLIDEMSQSSA
jgi:hypothetical protein